MIRLFTLNKAVLFISFFGVGCAAFAWNSYEWHHDFEPTLSAISWAVVVNGIVWRYLRQTNGKRNVFLDVMAWGIISMCAINLVSGIQYSAFSVIHHGVSDKYILDRKQADWDNWMGGYILIGLMMGLINFILLGAGLIRFKKSNTKQ